MGGCVCAFVGTKFVSHYQHSLSLAHLALALPLRRQEAFPGYNGNENRNLTESRVINCLHLVLLHC